MSASSHREPITPVGALVVYAAGFLMVILLASMSGMPVSGQSSLVLALSQGIGVIGYTLLRTWNAGGSWSYASI